MPDQLHDGPDAELLRLLDRAAADTVPPTSFDVSGTVAGGRRRLAHRRRVGALGVLAVAVVAAAVAVLPGLGETTAAPPAGDGRPTDKADRLGDTLSDRAALARLLADRDAGYSNVQYAGPSKSAVVLRNCGGGDTCTAAVLLTGDGWESHVAHLLPAESGYAWLQLMPDGAVAVVPDVGAEPFVLSRDGSTEPLHVSTEPVPDGTDALLVSEPPLVDDDEGASGSQVWALNAQDRTLRPLAHQPPAMLRGGVDAAAPGIVLAPIATRSGTGLRLAVSSDNGRSWQTRPGPSHDGSSSLPGMTVGQNGRVAVTFVPDGATIAPFGQLFVSSDYGETWQEVPAGHHPGTIGGVAFTADGRLLMADDMQHQLWQLTADETDLRPVAGDAPPISSLWSSGGTIVGETGHRVLAVTADGVDWRPVIPGLDGADLGDNPYQEVPASGLLTTQEMSGGLGLSGLTRPEPDRLAPFGPLFQCDDIRSSDPQRRRAYAAGTIVGGQRLFLGLDDAAAKVTFAAVVDSVSRCDTAADGGPPQILSRGTFTIDEVPGAAGWRYVFDVPGKGPDELAYVAVLREGRYVSVVVSVSDPDAGDDPGLDRFGALVRRAAERLQHTP
jgi:hypothetical protein